MTSPLLSVGPQARPDMRALSVDRNELHVFQASAPLEQVDSPRPQADASSSSAASASGGISLATDSSGARHVVKLRCRFGDQTRLVAAERGATSLSALKKRLADDWDLPLESLRLCYYEDAAAEARDCPADRLLLSSEADLADLLALQPAGAAVTVVVTAAATGVSPRPFHDSTIITGTGTGTGTTTTTATMSPGGTARRLPTTDSTETGPPSTGGTTDSGLLSAVSPLPDGHAAVMMMRPVSGAAAALLPLAAGTANPNPNPMRPPTMAGHGHGPAGNGVHNNTVPAAAVPSASPVEEVSLYIPRVITPADAAAQPQQPLPAVVDAATLPGLRRESRTAPVTHVHHHQMGTKPSANASPPLGALTTINDSVPSVSELRDLLPSGAAATAAAAAAVDRAKAARPHAASAGPVRQQLSAGGGGDKKQPRHPQRGATAGGKFSSGGKGAATTIRWQRGEVIGRGAFGTVYLGLNAETGELMAVKQLTADGLALSTRELAALEHEVSMLRGLFHENIVRYLGAQREGPPGSDGAESASAQAQTLSVFLEYVPGGSIRQLVARFGRLEEPVIRAYTRQLLLGLEYLHRSGIAHRDIKGGNVLVGNDGTIKLADFGASKRTAAALAAPISPVAENGDGSSASAAHAASAHEEAAKSDGPTTTANGMPAAVSAHVSAAEGPGGVAASSGAGLNSTQGSSSKISSSRRGEGMKGTPLWMAPEVVREEQEQELPVGAVTTSPLHNFSPSPSPRGLTGASTPSATTATAQRFGHGARWKKADIWSVGCTVIEMATGQPPWSELLTTTNASGTAGGESAGGGGAGGPAHIAAALYAIACTDATPAIPQHLSPAAHDFLRRCFTRDPAARPDVTSLLLHPFVAGVPSAALSAAAALRNLAAFGGGGVGGGGSGSSGDPQSSASSVLLLPPRPSTGTGSARERSLSSSMGMGMASLARAASGSASHHVHAHAHASTTRALAALAAEVTAALRAHERWQQERQREQRQAAAGSPSPTTLTGTQQRAGGGGGGGNVRAASAAPFRTSKTSSGVVAGSATPASGAAVEANSASSSPTRNVIATRQRSRTVTRYTRARAHTALPSVAKMSSSAPSTASRPIDNPASAAGATERQQQEQAHRPRRLTPPRGPAVPVIKYTTAAAGLASPQRLSSHNLALSPHGQTLGSLAADRMWQLSPTVAGGLSSTPERQRASQPAVMESRLSEHSSESDDAEHGDTTVPLADSTQSNTQRVAFGGESTGDEDDEVKAQTASNIIPSTDVTEASQLAPNPVAITPAILGFQASTTHFPSPVASSSPATDLELQSLLPVAAEGVVTRRPPVVASALLSPASATAQDSPVSASLSSSALAVASPVATGQARDLFVRQLQQQQQLLNDNNESSSQGNNVESGASPPAPVLSALSPSSLAALEATLPRPNSKRAPRPPVSEVEVQTKMTVMPYAAAPASGSFVSSLNQRTKPTLDDGSAGVGNSSSKARAKLAPTAAPASSPAAAAATHVSTTVSAIGISKTKPVARRIPASTVGAAAAARISRFGDGASLQGASESAPCGSSGFRSHANGNMLQSSSVTVTAPPPPPSAPGPWLQLPTSRDHSSAAPSSSLSVTHAAGASSSSSAVGNRQAPPPPAALPAPLEPFLAGPAVTGSSRIPRLMQSGNLVAASARSFMKPSASPPAAAADIVAAASPAGGAGGATLGTGIPSGVLGIRSLGSYRSIVQPESAATSTTGSASTTIGGRISVSQAPAAAVSLFPPLPSVRSSFAAPPATGSSGATSDRNLRRGSSASGSGSISGKDTLGSSSGGEVIGGAATDTARRLSATQPLILPSGRANEVNLFQAASAPAPATAVPMTQSHGLDRDSNGGKLLQASVGAAVPPQLGLRDRLRTNSGSSLLALARPGATVPASLPSPSRSGGVSSLASAGASILQATALQSEQPLRPPLLQPTGASTASASAQTAETLLHSTYAAQFAHRRELAAAAGVVAAVGPVSTAAGPAPRSPMSQTQRAATTGEAGGDTPPRGSPRIGASSNPPL